MGLQPRFKCRGKLTAFTNLTPCLPQPPNNHVQGPSSPQSDPHRRRHGHCHHRSLVWRRTKDTARYKKGTKQYSLAPISVLLKDRLLTSVKEVKARGEATPADKIAFLEQTKSGLVGKRKEIERKISQLEARMSGKADIEVGGGGRGRSWPGSSG